MLKSGELIWQSRGIPSTDPFSYTAYGLPWTNHEWLVAVLFHLIQTAGGMTALYAFKSAMVLATYGAVTWLGVKRAGSNPSAGAMAVLIMLAVSGGNLYFDVRAYLFTYILLAATMVILHLGYNKNQPRILYLMIPVTLLWINAHGGFILSYVIQMIYLLTVVGAFLADKFRFDLSPFRDFADRVSLLSPDRGEESPKTHPRKNKTSLMAHGGVVLILSLGAGFLNPYGGEIFSYPFSLFGDSFYKRHLIEWVPPDWWGTNLWFTITAIIVPVLFLLTARNHRFTDFLVLGAFTYLGLTVVRHGVLYSIAILPILAVIINSLGIRIRQFIFRQGQFFGHPLTDRILGIAVILALIIFMPGRFQNISTDRLGLVNELFPVAGVKFLQLNPLPGRMYNPYEWGGFFIWRLHPRYQVFIDGRANTVYPEEIYRESIFSMAGDPTWEQVMDRHQVNFIFCNKYLYHHNQHHLPDRLRESPDWVLIFEDDIELLFIRNIPGNHAIINKAHSGELNLPRTPYRLGEEAAGHMRKGRFSDARPLLMEALKLNPFHAGTLMKLGYVEMMEGDPRSAEKLYKKVLSLNRRFPTANYHLGVIARREGNLRRARRYFLRELRINPGFGPAGDELDRLSR